jgi:hypothetical protein
MTKALPVLDRTTGTGAGTSPISDKAHRLKHHHQRTLSPFSLYSPKLSVYILSTCVLLFILFHIQYSLHTPPSSPSPSWSLTRQWQRIINTSAYCNSSELKSMADRLRRSVTFLPLKDLRYAQAALQGHTWFMSSMYDSHEEGEVQFQQFPSESSQGRLLCMKGRDKHDGSWNSYALAWPETLPLNATFMKGLTFVSYNHYNYDNMWHGLSAMVLLNVFIFLFYVWYERN